MIIKTKNLIAILFLLLTYLNTTLICFSQEENDQDSYLAMEAAEQNQDNVIQNVNDLLRSGQGEYNDTYLGLHQWFADDWVSNFLTNTGQVIGKWLTEFIAGPLADLVKLLTMLIQIFTFNTNMIESSNIFLWIGQIANIIYSIATNLLLLLFIFCIWRFWVDAVNKGNNNIMGAFGRLIFTSSLLIVWPNIYSFDIKITNEMIQALFFNASNNVILPSDALSSALKDGLTITPLTLAQAISPAVGNNTNISNAANQLVLGTVGGIVIFAGIILFAIFGIVLIYEMIYFLILKAIQLALLTAQFIFAPLFLLAFSIPDIESYGVAYVKSLVETSLWSFIWIGLFKLLITIITAGINPWGKILIAIGILQIMMQVPSFLAQARISPIANFIPSGYLPQKINALSNTISSKGMSFLSNLGQNFQCLSEANSNLKKLTPINIPNHTISSCSDLLFNKNDQHLSYLIETPPKKLAIKNNASLPGTINNQAALSLIGVQARLARRLSSASLERGLSDPTTNIMSDHVLESPQASTFTPIKSTFSKDGTNKLAFTNSGELNSISMEKGASVQTVANLVMLSSLTKLAKKDAEAMQVISDNAFNENDSLKHALLGSSSYLSDTLPSNAYSQYLNKRFGNSLKSDDYITNLESLTNLNTKGKDRLEKTAELNKNIQSLSEPKRKLVIPALIQYGNEVAASYIEDAQVGSRTEAANQIIKNVSQSEVKALEAISLANSNQYISAPLVSTLASLSQHPSSSGTTSTYQSLKLVMKDMTGLEHPSNVNDLYKAEELVKQMYDQGLVDTQIHALFRNSRIEKWAYSHKHGISTDLPSAYPTLIY